MSVETSSESVPSAAAPRRRGPSLYTSLWALLGSLSLVYLLVLAVNPGAILTSLPESSGAGAPETNEGQRSAASAEADVKAVQEGLDQVRMELSRLRSEIAGETERRTNLEERIASVEQKNVQVADAAAEKAPSPPMKDTPAKAAPSADVTEAAPAAPAAPKTKTAAKPASSLKVINAPKPDTTAAKPAAKEAPPATALETGSVDPSAGWSAPAVVKPAGKPVGVIVGSGTSLDSLRLSWSLMADRNPDKLGALEPRYTTGIDASGLKYDLVAGPVASSTEAQKLCKELAAKAISCKVGEFKGDAL